MSACILVVDPAVTSRIVMKVKLKEARYDVELATSLEDARDALALCRPDLLIVALAQDAAPTLDFVRALRRDTAEALLPIVAVGGPGDRPARIAALTAGVDEVVPTPLDERLLLARIRALLRARSIDAELALRDEVEHVFGLAEAAEHFLGPGQTAIVTPGTPSALLRAHGLRAALQGKSRIVSHEEALGAAIARPPVDLFVIDGSTMDPALFADKVLRLIPELRARADTRLAPQLVILPEGCEGLGPMVLDLGADDLVRHDTAPGEIGHRAKRLIARKHRQDRHRATLRNGLIAATKDPLTGLYNRRYAEPRLRRMAERASELGRPLAMMVLDIDHFKAINDRWGHAAGDAVLRQVAQRLQSASRTEDLLARVGGEEFLLAMPDTGRNAAQLAAERLRTAIEDAAFSIPTTRAPLMVTLSIGVAIGGGGGVPEQIEEIVGRADAALYAAKTAGRNTVSLSAA